MGQKILSILPLKSCKVMTALPLKKLLPLLAHSMVVSLHFLDMPNPSKATDLAVTSALDTKCRVFLVEGIIDVFQLH